MRVFKAIKTVLFSAIVIIPALLQYLILILFCRRWFKNTRSKRVAEEGINHPVVNGVHHEVILCNGTNIHVARAGVDASKTLILFLHGFPEFWYSWRAQIEELQDDYEIAAIDLPGFNASGKPPKIRDYLTQNICQMIAALLDALGRETCILVGHDWGGAVANDFASMYPSRVTKLVMISVPPSPLFMENMDLHQLSCSFYLWQILVPGVIDGMLPAQDWAVVELMFTQESWGGLVQRDITPEDVEYFKDAAAVPGAMKAALSYHRPSVPMGWKFSGANGLAVFVSSETSFSSYLRPLSTVKSTRMAALWHSSVLEMNKQVDFGHKLNPRFQMPLLVLFGDSDSAVTLNVLRKIGRVAANVTVQVIPDCSHWVQQDAPEEVNQLLRDFIECPRDIL